MSEVREEKVVIIGGGLSGLVAGHELLKSQQQNPNKKFSFVVVEARDRVGGRTLSQVIGKRGAVMDLGGQWIGPNQKHVMELSQALGMKTFPQRTKGAAVSLFFSFSFSFFLFYYLFNHSSEKEIETETKRNRNKKKKKKKEKRKGKEKKK